MRAGSDMNPFMRRFFSALAPPRSTVGARTRRSMVLEDVEPRILHSADLAPVLVTDVPVPAQIRTMDPAPASTVDSVTVHQQTTHELVFVDAGTPDYQQLVDDIVAESSGTRKFDVVVLRDTGDGISQISEVLS